MTRQHGQGQAAGPVPHKGGMAASAVQWWLDYLWNVDSFKVTDQLSLCRRAEIDWIGNEEHGRLGLSAKKLFGNSDIHRDIAETVDGVYLAALGPGAQDDHLEANADRYEQLLAETGLVLRIALQTGAFARGGLQPATSGTALPRWRPSGLTAPP